MRSRNYTKMTHFPFKSCQRKPLPQHHLQWCPSTWGVIFLRLFNEVTRTEHYSSVTYSLTPRWPTTFVPNHKWPGSKTSVTVWTAVTQGWLEGNPWHKVKVAFEEPQGKRRFPPRAVLLFSAQTYFSKGGSLEFTSCMSMSKHVNCTASHEVKHRLGKLY